MKWWEDTIWIAIENPLKQDHENPSTENTVGGGCGKPQCSKFLTEKNNPKTCCSLTQTFQLNFRQLQHFKYWHHYRQTHCATIMEKRSHFNKSNKDQKCLEFFARSFPSFSSFFYLASLELFSMFFDSVKFEFWHHWPWKLWNLCHKKLFASALKGLEKDQLESKA